MIDCQPLKLLLNQQHPEHVQRMFTYYGYFSRARAAQIHSIEQHVARIDELDAQLSAETSRLAAIGREPRAVLRASFRASLTPPLAAFVDDQIAASWGLGGDILSKRRLIG